MTILALYFRTIYHSVSIVDFEQVFVVG